MTALDDPIYSLRATYEGDPAQYVTNRLGQRTRYRQALRPMYVSSVEAAERNARFFGPLVSVGTYRWEGGTWVEVSKAGARRAKHSRRPPSNAKEL